jgi:hypothetical protein
MSEETSASPAGEWVCLEVWGCRTHWGLLSEVERFGTKMARIDEYEPGASEPVRTRYYGGSSIFSVTPVEETYARCRADGRLVRPAALPAPDSRRRVEDVDFDDIEEEGGM